MSESKVACHEVFAFDGVAAGFQKDDLSVHLLCIQGRLVVSKAENGTDFLLEFLEEFPDHLAIIEVHSKCIERIERIE